MEEYIKQGTKTIADFLGIELHENPMNTLYPYFMINGGVSVNCSYHESYDWLMPAWIKFRDLRFDDARLGKINKHVHRDLCGRIKRKMMYEPILDAFREIVNGIEWHNREGKFYVPNQ